jgi:hypothetical protein
MSSIKQKIFVSSQANEEDEISLSIHNKKSLLIDIQNTQEPNIN